MPRYFTIGLVSDYIGRKMNRHELAAAIYRTSHLTGEFYLRSGAVSSHRCGSIDEGLNAGDRPPLDGHPDKQCLFNCLHHYFDFTPSAPDNDSHVE
jgi:hypothetical protein